MCKFYSPAGKEIGKEEFICRYSTIYYLDYNLQNDFPIGALKSKASKRAVLLKLKLID